MGENRKVDQAAGEKNENAAEDDGGQVGEVEGGKQTIIKDRSKLSLIKEIAKEKTLASTRLVHHKTSIYNKPLQAFHHITADGRLTQPRSQFLITIDHRANCKLHERYHAYLTKLEEKQKLEEQKRLAEQELKQQQQQAQMRQ